ncbi:hypothetical protein [Pseudomonas sp. W4I3]|uniref:hypothetical protein n=1 Tax=Pseudomonas sp. W4I3 TaxID=3042294 RepID=UPI002786DD72|nr:hypothetical protein [Pseudomonas sp. W4I3]MDQ0741984.1 putative delta-60 repeat protein [Pseudomonas sp. W4I3]
MSIPSIHSVENTAGSPDLSFGNTTPKTGEVFFNQVYGISRAHPDGSTLTAGNLWIEGATYIGLTKHKQDGALDTDYGLSLSYVPSGTVFLGTLRLQSDAKPVLLGSLSFDYTAFISRFDDKGALDPDFGRAGTVTLNKRFDIGRLTRSDLAVLPNGNILAMFNDITSSYIFQLDSDGEQINFGQTGPIELPGIFLNALLPTPEGFIVAGSRARKAFVMGYLHDGTANPSFGDQGLVTLPFTDEENKQATALAQAINGDIAIVGNSYYTPQEINFITRLKANGEPDLQFNNGIPRITDVKLGAYVSLVVQADGKIVAMARDEGRGHIVNLIRHTLAGQWDVGFGVDGVALAYRGSPANTNYVTTLELVQPDEKLQSSGYLGSSSSIITRTLSR